VRGLPYTPDKDMMLKKLDRMRELIAMLPDHADLAGTEARTMQ
jgi:hypothetical protein